jgi:hypothetical protein
MGHDRQLSAGLFAGADKAICRVLGLEGKKQLKQRTTYQEVARRRVPRDKLVVLVRELYGLVRDNAKLCEHTPSDENWRWKLQTGISNGNESLEVVLERAVALLAGQGHLADLSEQGHPVKWCNQIPVASGLIDDKLDKRAAVDLARIAGDRLDLYELSPRSLRAEVEERHSHPRRVRDTAVWPSVSAVPRQSKA